MKSREKKRWDKKKKKMVWKGIHVGKKGDSGSHVLEWVFVS